MHRLLKFTGLAALGAGLAVISAQGGDEDQTGKTPERKEFHMSAIYPYVFSPKGYLQTEEPMPMRYGEPAIDTIHRAAPKLPVAAEGTPPPDPKQVEASQKKAAEVAAAQAAAEAAAAKNEHVEVATAAGPAAYPVPDNGPNGIPKGGADFTKMPDEVVGYFRNPYNFVPDSHRFFDPIFEPAEPQNAQQGPQSSATYVVKP